MKKITKKFPCGTTVSVKLMKENFLNQAGFVVNIYDKLPFFVINTDYEDEAANAIPLKNNNISMFVFPSAIPSVIKLLEKVQRKYLETKGKTRGTKNTRK